MICAKDLLIQLRPLHVCVRKTGHVDQVGQSFKKLCQTELMNRRFLEIFEVLRPAQPSDMAGLRDLVGHNIRLRLRDVPDILMRGLVIADGEGGVIIDLSFGIAVVDAVKRFELTAQDFAPSDLAVELLFLQEAKSSAMAASFSLNARLDGARLAAESEALTDGLTGLHNRRALDAAMDRLGKSQTEFAVLHMDLDLFKAVNDTLGHAIGDAVLKRVSAIMRRNTRKDDLLVRAGGDEFVIVCPGLTDHARLAELSEKMIHEISMPTELDGQTVKIGASIGIGLATLEEQAKAEQVVERADIALYAVKRSGRGQFMFWKPEHGQSLAELDLPHVAMRE